MISFFLSLNRLARALWRLRGDAEFRALGILALLILLSGVFFYRQVEGWGWLDALYFCVMTLATVGYGDFAPSTDFGKIFTIIYTLVGIGVFVGIFARIAQALIAQPLIKPAPGDPSDHH